MSNGRDTVEPARAIPAAIFVLLCSFSTNAAEPASDRFAGCYRIVAYTIMPHLDEMRRIARLSDACIAAGEVDGLFPIMAQPAFTGCTLINNGKLPGAGSYRLVCRDRSVATGRATVQRNAAGLSGRLSVKMGGKNMTFSQKVIASKRPGIGR